MSAPLSHQQLSMFMTAKDLSNLRWGDQRKDETKEQVIQRKLEESKTGNWSTSKHLYKSIKRSGVKRPVEVIVGKHPKTGAPIHDLGEGHHRVASALDINPNMLIPVKYEEI